MNQHLVVVGGGMVAQRLVEALRDRDTAGTWRITETIVKFYAISTEDAEGGT